MFSGGVLYRLCRKVMGMFEAMIGRVQNHGYVPERYSFFDVEEREPERVHECCECLGDIVEEDEFYSLGDGDYVHAHCLYRKMRESVPDEFFDWLGYEKKAAAL